MDFDEYEYLEKTVENTESEKSKEAVNGVDEQVKSVDKDRRLSSRHRGEDDEDLDPKSKRSRSGDDARGRDHHREKSSSRHRSRSREGERSEKDGERHKSSREHRDRTREKEERNGRDRDRDKDRDKVRDRDSERKERPREKEGEKDKDDRDRRSKSRADRHRDDRGKSRDREAREKSRDREHGEKSRGREVREKSRDRDVREKSRDRDVREKSRDRDVREKSRDKEHREKSRDREHRERSRDRDLRDRESRRHKDKKDEATEPEADPERDQRTVFAYQLHLRADERDIFEFFSRAGKVRDVRLIMDRNSKRSKGVGYIEFYDVMSVPMAIAMSGQPIRGQPVMVKPSEAEKNLVQSTSTAAGGTSLTGAGAARKLYVGNLVPNITEEQIRAVFEAFGPVELVQLPRDETGLCKGFAFVQFARLEDAKASLTVNGQLDIGGRYIKVSAVTDHPGMQDAGATTTGDLDDDEGGGLALNASSRALLMQKLDRSGSALSVTGSLASSAVNAGGFSTASAPMIGSVPIVSPMLGGIPIAGLPLPPVGLPVVDTIGVPSECLLLKNMFDPKMETEPDFDLDIKEDVQDECTKFGALRHIFVDKFSEGHVYLKFENTQAAMSAQQALHGRWFAGKMITATFMLPHNYEDKFPESR